MSALIRLAAHPRPSQSPQLTDNGKGLVTAATNITITPSAIGAPTTTGSGAYGTWPIGITGSTATVTTNANLTGDVTSVGNAATLASVNGNVGSFTNANVTVDAKGRITADANGTSGGVTSFTSRTGAVSPASGDYTFSEVTGAAPLDSPTFTGTVSLPAGTVVNGVTLTSTGSTTAFSWNGGWWLLGPRLAAEAVQAISHRPPDIGRNLRWAPATPAV